jgi:hypothetical protein
MGEAPLDRPGVVALVCEGVADGMAEHLGVRLGLKLGSAPAAARSIILAKPAVVKGAPRSLTNTDTVVGLSRWSRVTFRSSPPSIGRAFGVPCLARGRGARPR